MATGGMGASSGARTALDAGTGNGLLAADLRARVPEVTAIDLFEHLVDAL